MRWVAVLLVACTVVAWSAAGETATVRVVTYNMLHGGPSSGLTGNGMHLERRLELAVAALAALRPDIVALQEASVGRGRGNVAARVAAGLGLRYVHAPATSRVFGIRPLDRLLVWLMNFDEGPAILSRFPIVAAEVHDLPRCIRHFDPRVLLRAELDTPWGRLQVYSTHTSRADCQVERVADVVLERAAALPSIVMGDLNSGETSRAIVALGRDRGWIDAFRMVNPDAPGLTVWQRIELAIPTVFRRVDYVFLAPGRHVRGEVRASRVVLDVPGRLHDGTPLWPSDHYGVMADLDLGTGAVSSFP
jgi:endonuclease/exonuclease/phosphatase family metal-dependent hydrolase